MDRYNSYYLHAQGHQAVPIRHVDLWCMCQLLDRNAVCACADRKFVSWLLGVILGMPAKQTRFHGLHRVTAGVMYLQAVIRICRTPYLSAHPTQHVPQLDGWVVARPATDADCKRGSSRGRPVYVVEYPYFLTASLKHVQVCSPVATVQSQQVWAPNRPLGCIFPIVHVTGLVTRYSLNSLGKEMLNATTFGSLAY